MQIFKFCNNITVHGIIYHMIWKCSNLL